MAAGRERISFSWDKSHVCPMWSGQSSHLLLPLLEMQSSLTLYSRRTNHPVIGCSPSTSSVAGSSLNTWAIHKPMHTRGFHRLLHRPLSDQAPLCSYSAGGLYLPFKIQFKLTCQKGFICAQGKRVMESVYTTLCLHYLILKDKRP